MRPSGRAPTLAQRFDPRHNSLNALRLLFAALVIVSHAWPLGGFGPDPSVGGVGLGAWAVAGFFAISGYLITASRMRSSLGHYLWRRFLRIFPGLWVCVVIIALVFAPIAAATRSGPDGLSATNLVSYVLTNGLFVHAHLAIGSTLHAVPFADSWDGSLWTLRYEFGCYLLLGAVLSLPIVRRHPAWLAGIFAACVAVTIAVIELHVDVPVTLFTACYLGTYFFAGALTFIYADRIRLSVSLLGAACIALAAAVWSGHVLEATALPLAVLVMALGATLPLQRIGSRNDISYGFYIYAFPVQQALALAGAQRLGVVAFILLALAGTLPLAAASWFFVERRAMRLKGLSLKTGQAVELVPSVTAGSPG